MKSLLGFHLYFFLFSRIFFCNSSFDILDKSWTKIHKSPKVRDINGMTLIDSAASFFITRIHKKLLFMNIIIIIWKGLFCLEPGFLQLTRQSHKLKTFYVCFIWLNRIGCATTGFHREVNCRWMLSKKQLKKVIKHSS